MSREEGSLEQTLTKAQVMCQASCAFLSTCPWHCIWHIHLLFTEVLQVPQPPSPGPLSTLIPAILDGMQHRALGAPALPRWPWPPSALRQRMGAHICLALPELLSSERMCCLACGCSGTCGGILQVALQLARGLPRFSLSRRLTLLLH